MKFKVEISKIALGVLVAVTVPASAAVTYTFTSSGTITGSNQYYTSSGYDQLDIFGLGGNLKGLPFTLATSFVIDDYRKYYDGAALNSSAPYSITLTIGDVPFSVLVDSQPDTRAGLNTRVNSNQGYESVSSYVNGYDALGRKVLVTQSVRSDNIKFLNGVTRFEDLDLALLTSTSNFRTETAFTLVENRKSTGIFVISPQYVTVTSTPYIPTSNPGGDGGSGSTTPPPSHDVPEPGAACLMAIGLLGMVGLRRRHRRPVDTLTNDFE